MGSPLNKTSIEQWRAILPEEVKKRFDALPAPAKARFMGMAGSGRKEYDSPKYALSSDEKRIAFPGNSHIVLGYDRPHSRASGYGGMGNIHCSSIDIVAGMLGYQARRHGDNGKKLIVNPNFKKDAARIYISQKAAVDHVNYFDLPAGTVGNVNLQEPRSTIALKADTLRFIARENIKLITRTDKKNSQGGETTVMDVAKYGIDLIGCNDDSDMQPLVKGANLQECLKDIIANVNQLRDRLVTYMDYNRNLLQELLTHTHYSPFYGLSTSPSLGLMQTGVETMLNTAMNVEIPCMSEDLLDGKKGGLAIQFKYLGGPPGIGIMGQRPILSRYNNTN